MHFSNTVTIRRPIHEVFAFLADFENVPKWNYAIAVTRQTSLGSVGVGTTYHQVRSLPARSEETFTVTAFDPDKRLAIEGGLGPFEGVLSYDLEPVDGGTRLTNTADLRGHGMTGLVAPFAVGRVSDAVAANLGTLRNILETRS